jgi:hypothetical protein
MTAASAIGRAAAATLLIAGAGLVTAACSANGSPPRVLPRTLYGVTVDNVAGLDQIVSSSRHLPEMPTTRVYFDVSQPPGQYASAVRQLRPFSYLMGELLDSSEETRITTAAYARRVSAYLEAFGDAIDIWEIGNEVNGNWTGPYPVVAAKLNAAYSHAAAMHVRTALTLYFNAGCGDGPAELSPLEFSRRYASRAVRDGLSYVFLSYYEGQCGGVRPTAATWTAYFRSLHALYPHAMLGFGEVGLTRPVTPASMRAATSLIRYYYGLRVRLPYYAGGYFWWYYAEDCVPYAAKPLWRALSTGFHAEETAQRQ